jgi:hypothetical protein
MHSSNLAYILARLSSAEWLFLILALVSALYALFIFYTCFYRE